MCRALTCSSSGDLSRKCIYAASGINIYHICNSDVDLLKISRVMLETCREF